MCLYDPIFLFDPAKTGLINLYIWDTMKKHSYPNDPLGRALYDYYFDREKEGRIKTISELGGIDYMPASMFFRTYGRMPELEKIALKYCRGSVLDVGAGAGCHALWLQHNGHTVTAIDTSPGAVDIMKEQGVSDARQVSFYEFTDKPYDTIFMMMNGIGFTGDLQGLEKFFSHVKTLIHKDSVILLDSTDISYLFSERNQTVEIDLSSPYYGVFDFVMEYKNIRSEKFYWLYIDFISLEVLANDFGFEAVKLYEDDHYQYLAELKQKK
ncbi:MAG: class I SAM-dependent methyltransferase [Bacteroidales bacterium]|nr:class I SAM-dependent methyltransferase [Bacteroidales bacterium]MCF8337512.1 class I SAM-dependent methyltransferase [Bacteroidales bacterium]